MKALGLLLLVVVGSLGFLRWREMTLARQEQAKAQEAAALAAEASAKAPAATPARAATPHPATKSSVEHSVTTTTPKPKDTDIRADWGWKSRGALDQPAKK
jgi:cytoskeletal protein RodZ